MHSRTLTRSSLKILVPPFVDRFVAAFAARWARFAAFIGGVALVATIVAFLLPAWYQAPSTLLPPPDPGDAYGTLSGLIQSNALKSIGLSTTSTTSDVFADILRSRTIHEAAIERFELTRLYKTKTLDPTLREFQSHLKIRVGSSGIITLSFEDHDANRAAEITNFLVGELDRFNREVYGTRAKRARKFLETRLADTQARLAEAQMRLGSYEREHKELARGAPDQAAMEGAANLMTQKYNLQIRRSYVSEYAGETSSVLRELDAQLAAVEGEIAKLPALRMLGARLSLEVEVQSKLFALISAQYEEARIQEARDTPTITVLDVARAPETRERPKRRLIVMASVLIALGFCVGYVLLELRAVIRP
ncbi:MAG: hypothetical protein A2V88_13630 [Elusimicrobia bacterium RBG_16_66_12]|nr:MAG: hypothetical protein A2V88_13630 [Elusimicrobia bacterium RBG_16_66_12]